MLDPDKLKSYLLLKLTNVLSEIGEEIEQEMKSKAPVDTGFLRDNIGHQVNVNGDNADLEFWSKADYSIFVDKGTSKMEPQPFFESSLVGLERKIAERMAK